MHTTFEKEIVYDCFRLLRIRIMNIHNTEPAKVAGDTNTGIRTILVLNSASRQMSGATPTPTLTFNGNGNVTHWNME